MRKITLREVAKEIGTTKQYVDLILLGDKKCSFSQMEILKKFYPNLKFEEIHTIRYKVIGGYKNE